ncbi:hypothetical protein PHYPSEUDO_011940 [Phytophthora pseudosyringae]|uniref:Uncharacterized protein n=1 Tax=Phytophthora pseudosyringae TaxID=221518 RepID=A0A8T1VB06_9STRA|nr:hypothetical protein PHYPSEUDO_011940 [Phytophthora pseudosyringae]
MAHAVSCRFLRLDCSEEGHPLFRREYARNNRERGVKLLRCFPHCCPEHARRGYCGCSVHVRVTFLEGARAVPPDEVVVCARFEPTRVAPLWPAGAADMARTVGATVDRGGGQEGKCRLDVGERVELPESVFGSAGGAPSDGGEWVLAEKESDANQRAVPQNSVLYVLNNRISPKWLYSYDSSVTRTQREMTHHLVAYVFQVLPGRRPMAQQIQQQAPAGHNVVVLARHASPGFYLVSYRRSGGVSGNPGCPLPAIDTPTDTMDVAPSRILSASWKVHELQQQHLQQQQWLQQQRFQQRLQLHHGQHDRLQWGRQGSSLQPTHAIPSANDAVPLGREVDMEMARDDDESAQETGLWQQEAEASSPGFREKGQQLLILWYFLGHVSMNDLGVSTVADREHLRSHWLRAAAALRAPRLVANAQLEGVVVSFLSTMFEVTPAFESPPNHDPLGLKHGTIRVCGHLFLRALSSRAVQQRLSSGFQVAGGGTNTRAKCAALIVDLWELLGVILREVTEDDAAVDGGSLHPHQTATLPALVDDVMSIAYSQARFGGARTEISALLLDRQTPDSLVGALNRASRVFVAQVQASTMASGAGPQQGPLQQHIGVVMGTGSLHESAWCRRWLLEPGSLQVVNTAADANYRAALLPVCLLVREVGCIDMKVTQGAMSLRAALALSVDTSSAPMELVLDGQTRVFRALPSGIASSSVSTGRCSVGDYSATLSQDGQSIDLHFFAFSEDRGGRTGEDATAQPNVATTVAHRVSLSLALEQEPESPETMGGVHPRTLFIVVQGTVCSSTYYEGARAPGPRISAMSSSDRAELWHSFDWTPVLEVQGGYIAVN